MNSHNGTHLNTMIHIPLSFQSPMFFAVICLHFLLNVNQIWPCVFYFLRG
jgi:hypothetical protein